MKTKYLIILIIAVGIFLRFWQVANVFHFMMDEERDALIFARVFKTGHIPLIGGSIPGGLYVGPIYTWISAILLFMFNYDYSRLGLISAFASSVSLPFLYFAVKKIINKKVALISLIIYSFSFLIVQFNRRYWPPTFAPTFLILILYAFSIWKEKLKMSFSIITISLIIGVQSDPSNVAILIAVFLYLFFILKEKLKSAVLLGLVIASQLPLFIFELRHNFFLFHAIINFLSPKPGSGKTHFLNIVKLFEEISKTFTRIFFVPGNRDLSFQFPPEPALVATRNNIPFQVLLIFLIILMVGFYFLIRQKSKESRFVSIFMIVVFFGITIYNIFFPGYTYEWFFTVALPTLALIAGCNLYSIFPKKYVKR